MPNYIKNRLVISGTPEKVKEVFEKYNTKLETKATINHFPDFNKVLPQPENIFNGDIGREDEKMCKKEGRPTWYDWNRQNWGTKWNSRECVEEKYNSFTFVTAWNGVPNLMLEISKQNEGIEFLYEYADEYTGYNCASYKFINGEVIEENKPKGGSKEAYELAFKLRPHYTKYYKLVGETYEYV